MIFIDTNILIDVIAPNQPWRDWSIEKIELLGGEQPLVIDHIVLAELASGFSALEEVTDWLSRLGVEIRLLDDAAAFAAGQAFRRYRRSGPDRSSMLSDLLIGAHAQALDATLLTRDSAIYLSYFPELELITPEAENG